MISVKEVCEKIWKMEDDLSLLEKKIGNEIIWPLVRMSVYYQISQKTGVFSTPHGEKMAFRNFIEAISNIIKAPFTSPFNNKNKIKYLVYDHPRKVLSENQYIDIYTKSLIDKLPEEETEIWENWYTGRHLTKNSNSRKYLDSLSIFTGIASLLPYKLTTDEKQFIYEIEKRIHEDFNIKLPLISKFSKEIRHHKVCKKYFIKLLTLKKPEKIFLVVSYSWYKRGLISAAKHLNIETIEIQHGTFSPYHLGYNFPGKKVPVEPFPDKLYTFGDYWNNLASMPIENDKIQTWGFDHFNNQVQKINIPVKKEKTILIISQGVIGKKLSKIIPELAKLLPDHHIAYKLHPGEYDLWRTDYPELLKASTLKNVQILDNNNTGLYEHFAASKYLVGVFSTAIYEGLALKCITFILDLPGAEYMDYLVENNMVIKVSTASQIAEKIVQNVNVQISDSNYIFAKIDGVKNSAL